MSRKDPAIKDRAWDMLERLVQKGCAVAVRTNNRGLYHVRVVKNEKVSECEATSMEDGLLSVEEPKRAKAKEIEA